MTGRLLLILIVSTTVAGCGAGGGAAGIPPLPFAPVGAMWTYRITETPPVGPPTTSITTLVYRGVVSYRGTSYQLFEDTNSLSPGFVERIYMMWDGSLTRIAALVEVGTATVELVFDKTWVLNQAAESQSGMVQRFVNGTLFDTILWSIVTSNGGTVVVIVPAGTFTATKWDGILNVGGAQPYSSFTSAHTEIKRQFTAASGTQVLFELASGSAASVTSRAAAEMTATARLLELGDLRRQIGR